MAAVNTQTTTDLSLVDRARGLLDGIRSRAERTERERRVPAETIEEFKATGLLRALQAKRVGGLERSPDEFFMAVVEVGTVCPSTAWVLGVLGVHPFENASFPVEAQDEVYGDDPDTIISSSYAATGLVERVPGGYRMSGRWSFSSGCDHGSWVVLGATDRAEPDPKLGRRIFLVPRSDYRIDDNWHVMGLAGTGSKDIVIEDAFVPEHRTVSSAAVRGGYGPGLAVNTAPLFRCPHGAIYNSGLAAPALGAAKGALAEFCASAKQRSRAFSPKTAVSGDPFLQLRLAESAADIDGAELRLRRDYHEMLALAEAGVEIPLETRARYRWDAVHTANTCAVAVHRLLEVSGGRSVFLSNPMQRFYRDTQAIRQHAFNDYEHGAQIAAAAHLGLPLEQFML